MKTGIGMSLIALAGLGFSLLSACQKPPPSSPQATPRRTPSPAQQVSTLPQIDEIRAKLAAIKEYYCVLNVSSKVTDGQLAYTEERWFRRPNLLHAKQIQTNHTVRDMIGSVRSTISTGDTMWRYTQNAPGSGRFLAERLRSYPGGSQLSQAVLEESIRRHESPQLIYYDLGRMAQAGISGDEALARAGWLITPFRNSRCTETTAKLHAEDETSWTFSAAPDPAISKTVKEARLTFNKADGVLTRVHYISPD